MKKMVLAAVLGSVMGIAGAGAANADSLSTALDNWTLYSDETIACVAKDAEDTLTDGQYALLQARFDPEVSSYDVAKELDLGLDDFTRVNAFIAIDPTSCVLNPT